MLKIINKRNVGIHPLNCRKNYNFKDMNKIRQKSLSRNKFFLNVANIEEETLDWYRMSPAERFAESLKLWEVFILLGGNYEPEPDTQSPFNIFYGKKQL